MKNIGFKIILLLVTQLYFGQENLSKYKGVFDGPLKRWTQTIPGFSLQNFKQENSHDSIESPIEKFTAKELTTFLAQNKALLYLSPDGKHYVDAYSNDVNYNPKRKAYEAAYDVDSEVKLGDVTSKSQQRIMFFGSSSYFDDAVWVNNQSFVMVTIYRNEKDKKTPYITIGDVKNKTLTSYKCNASQCEQTINYKSNILSKIKLVEPQ